MPYGRGSEKGVFWVIDGELLAIPFDENSVFGISKSGNNYNHRSLWEHVKPPKCNKGYDYYHRGRVEINSRGSAVIFLNRNIDECDLVRVKESFSLSGDVKIHYDGSDHYKCHWDRE